MLMRRGPTVSTATFFLGDFDGPRGYARSISTLTVAEACSTLVTTTLTSNDNKLVKRERALPLAGATPYSALHNSVNTPIFLAPALGLPKGVGGATRASKLPRVLRI